MHRRWLGLVLGSASIAVLSPSCGAPADPWPAYKAIAEKLSGEWTLGPGNADSIPGAPSCATSLIIEMSVPDVRPPGGGTAGHLGTARLAFCGKWQDVEVVDAAEEHMSMWGNDTEPNADKSESAPAKTPKAVWEGTAYDCVLEPRSTASSSWVRWHLHWQPVRSVVVADGLEAGSPHQPRFKLVEEPELTFECGPTSANEQPAEGDTIQESFSYTQTLVYQRAH